GVGCAATHRRGQVAAPPAGLPGAMILHGLWNGPARQGPGGLALVYVVDLCIPVALVVSVFAGRRGTVRPLDPHLPASAETGLVTPQDIRMLGSLHARRAARRWARVVGGPAAGRAMADYQLAATELALLHKRADRGVADPRWFVARRDALLGLMALARQAFLRTQAHPRRTRPSGPPWAAGQGGSGFLPPSPPGPYGR